MQLELYVTA